MTSLEEIGAKLVKNSDARDLLYEIAEYKKVRGDLFKFQVEAQARLSALRKRCQHEVELLILGLRCIHCFAQDPFSNFDLVEE